MKYLSITLLSFTTGVYVSPDALQHILSVFEGLAVVAIAQYFKNRNNGNK